MPDPIANFPLRDASVDRLSDALGYSFGEFQAWNGQALNTYRFPQHSLVSGVETILRDEFSRAVTMMSELGWIREEVEYDREAALEGAVQQQVASAVHGAETAAIVLLHSACELFLWRVIRLGLVINRERACQYVSKRKCEIGKLAVQDKDDLIDDQIEIWWEHLERDSIVKKWDTLATLVGFPEHFNSPPIWHFDRAMLEQFDSVRINAVHHNRSEVAAFDFMTFAAQLNRALMKWATFIGISSRLIMRPDAFLGFRRFDHGEGNQVEGEG